MLQGALTRAVNAARVAAGALGLSGAVAGVKAGIAAYTVTVPGALGLSGAVSRVLVAARAAAGAVGFAGTADTGSVYTATGALSPAGAVTRTLVMARAPSGSLGLSGMVTRRLAATRRVTATLDLPGELTDWYKEMLYYGVAN
jgi:hypothetical protein